VMGLVFGPTPFSRAQASRYTGREHVRRGLPATAPDGEAARSLFVHAV
jgi:hypothetical protein